MDIENDISMLFRIIRKVVPPSVKVYLVGGAVRDLLLDNPINDYDFAAEGLVRPIGKKIADELHGKYYVMDEEREMVRVIVETSDKDYYNIDIALMSGDSITDDLKMRDFTIDAIAVSIENEHQLIDPLNGASDLINKRLNMCSPDSIDEDPLRAMRAIRIAQEYGLEMSSDLVKAIQNSATDLNNCSTERCRDEFLKILSVRNVAISAQLMMRFQQLPVLFPEIEDGDYQELIAFLHSMEPLIDVLTRPFDEDKTAKMLTAYAVLKLGSYREKLTAFFNNPDEYTHKQRCYLYLAGFLDLPSKSADARTQLIKKRCRNLVLSVRETNLLVDAQRAKTMLHGIVKNTPISDLDIYRYYSDCHKAGIYGCFLYLAEIASDLNILTDDTSWRQAVDVCEQLFTAWFERNSEVVAPKPLLNGRQLRDELNVPEGPGLGEIKKRLIEAQVQKTIQTREEAEAFVQMLLA